MAEVSAEKLVARLAGGKPIPAIVLIGTDAYLSDLCRKQIIEACVPEAARDWAVARIRGDGAGWMKRSGARKPCPCSLRAR